MLNDQKQMILKNKMGLITESKKYAYFDTISHTSWNSFK